MSIQFFGDDDPQILADRLRRLADDIDRLVADGRPRPDEMATAPTLDWWRPALRQAPALIGVAHGRPGAPSARPTLTSDLYAADMRAGWARSWTRWYALGRPCPGRPA